MFALSLLILGLAAVGLANPHKRFHGITVELSGPKSINTIDDLKLTASVTNAGSEAVKLLKYATILDDKLPTKSFTITKDGSEVAFQGVKIAISLEDLDDSAFTTLGAGESLTVSHEIAALFDFESAGEGTFNIEPSVTFQAVSAEERLAAVTFHQITAIGSKVDVEIFGDLARRQMKQRKRAVDTCTDFSKKSFIDAGYTEAKLLARVASSYVSTHGADSLYQQYFKTTPTSTVISVYNAVANENSSSRTLNCNDPFGACTSGVIAYTVISTTNIYFCSIFFTELPLSSLCTGTPVSSRNIRGETILHELTHAVAGTEDIVYGCSNDIALSASNSVRNADNYSCFAAQVYQNTEC
ncbi:hypothetical protein AMATHDRAFT_43144 [Amanita thiersii Skay4041]|uniref:Neutral protease 2 n=1 Tax=Amanita thiersii Skay4041 TaxID=703135 RepID=A0A2A9NH71_9AGAR|nr:hypothetical protein AMATHDRAFT_43144 [Amanita thiersii Skay4041]